MTRSLVLLASIATVTSLTFLPSAVVRADDDAADTSMSQFQFSGLINSDNVYVRSGASENDYPILKLSKGDTVVVVGAKGDWLKIIPPDNTFCVVGKVWVEARGDGKIGRVRDGATNTNVRIGSNLNDMKAKVVGQLKPGDDVKILGNGGDSDEYFKIAPPPGVFVYVHKKFVDPVKRVDVVSNNGTLEVKSPESTAAATANAPLVTSPAGVAPTPPTTAGAEASVATKTPSAPAATQPAIATTPTTAPALSDTQQFDALEAKFMAASKLPIDQQPISELIDGYQKITTEKQLPDSMLKIAAYRLSGLEVRRDAVTQLKETEKAAAASAARQLPLQAEQKEIAERMKANETKNFTAVGTLRTSSIYANGKPLYRLTDPASGRTVVYVETTDPTIIAMEGSFIGIHGNVAEDNTRQIKYITPTSATAIDPADVTRGAITSGMTPPSVAPGASGNQ